MDDNCKKQLLAAHKFIQQKSYAEAMEILEIMVYKYSKVFKVHLMTGLCFSKLNKPQQAEKAYLQVIDLVPDEPNALKGLCDIYTQRGDVEKSAKYLQLSVGLLRKGDQKRYKQAVVKLIDFYEKELNMQKIDGLFQQYCAQEEVIGQDFVHLAKAYFRVGTTNQCFFLQKFEAMGVNKQAVRGIVAGARQGMNTLMIDIVDYLKAVAGKYELTKKDIANSLMEMKMYFPQCTSLLMLMLFDQYCVGQMGFSSHILQELYQLCIAQFDHVQNIYHNLRFTAPQVFAVCMILAKEYLCFFKQFFTLEPIMDQYYVRLVELQGQLQATPIREEYRKRIEGFILRECRTLAELSKHGNIVFKLETMKERIEALNGSYLQEVIAKIALHSFTSYNQLNDMKYKLKLRIKQLSPESPAPHLYKYYYDYVFKMARIFKSLDQEIPIKEVLEYIVTHDPIDYRYQLELLWFNFSMEAKGQNEVQKIQKVKGYIVKVQQLIPKLEQSIRSQAIRRLIILKVVSGDYEIQTNINQVLAVERSFQNLQCAAFFYSWKQKNQQSLALVRQAYKLNQNHYHTNRLYFLMLYKCGFIKQAFLLLQHLHSSFSGVFWINYFIGINKINQKLFLEAEGFINKSLQAFQAGSLDNFRFGFQKVHDIGTFSLLHLVQQNQYCIFFDEIILPEQYVYSVLPALSNLYFQREAESSCIKLFLKQGELLKILGRTKSSLNYLEQAYQQSQRITIDAQTSPKILIDNALVHKEYATILFYSSQLRQAEQMLVRADAIVKLLLAVEQSGLVLKLDDQVQALFFQISISRLSGMMRFQSQQCISDYLTAFQSYIRAPRQPSLTFLKNKYQFFILQFMHQRTRIDQIQASVGQFLQFFNLMFENRSSQGFAIRLQQLGQSERRFVRECIQDYYIARALCNPVEEEELLHMLSLFPRSSVLCVLLGSVAKDVSLQSGSFLKVIQLDKQSSISMDILAGHYLKQKNYLAAAKLFLKSLECDVLNPKCYLGLAACLFCLVLRAVQKRQVNQLSIVRQCLVRINSYMEFIRLNDPSEHYHILGFLRILLTDEPATHFANRLVLQAVHPDTPNYRQSLIAQLYKIATKYSETRNFWQKDHQIQIVQSFISKIMPNVEKDHHVTVIALAERASKSIQALAKSEGAIGKQIGIKHFQKLLHEIGIIVCLALKTAAFQKEIFNLLLKTIKRWQQLFKRWGFSQDEQQHLKKKIKQYLFEYIMLGDWSAEYASRTNEIFSNISSYRHLITYASKIPNLQREISRSILLNPGNEEIRQIYTGFIVSQKGWNLRKARLQYKLELLNNNNLDSSYDAYTYKKIFLLYRDPNAMLLYLQSQWSLSGARSQQNVLKFVALADYLLQKCEVGAMKEKCQRMKLEMIAYLQTEFGKLAICNLTTAEKDQLKKIVVIQTIMKKINNSVSFKSELSTLKALFNSKDDQFDWWILMSLINYLIRRVQPQRFENLLKLLVETVPNSSLKAFSIILRFLVKVRQDPTSQQQLVEQIINLTELCGACQNLVSPTTQVILECNRCLLTNSWEQVQVQLSKAAQTMRITTYSDQILINFFEVLKQYRVAQSNPNGEGVIQAFLYLVDNQLQLLRQPLLRGFVLSLRGIVVGLVREGQQPNDIKMAMLLSPAAAKSLLSRQA